MKKMKIFKVGTSGIEDEEAMERIVLINSISVVVGISIAVIGTLLYRFVVQAREPKVVIALVIEFIINGLVLVLNYKREHRIAAWVLYILQCAAIGYFGVILVNTFHLEFVIILLVAIICLIFKEPHYRKTALVLALTVLAILELKYFKADAHPAVFENYNQIFAIRLVLVIAIIGITIRISRPLVWSNDMKFELKRANDLRKIFVAQITHELRTPLDNIHYISQLLRSEVQKDESLKKIKSMVDVNFTVSAHARSIVNNVLGMAEIEAGKTPPAINEAFKVVPFFEKIMEVHRIVARREEMRLQLQVDPKMPEVIFSDPLNINQVLTNLLTNAFKYGSKGKTIKVEVRRNDYSWQMQVSNSGPEISPEKMDAIFDPFFTGKTGHIQGSGLGLYIVKSKVSSMGGDVRVACQPGGQTAFTVTFPLREGKLRDLPDGIGSDEDGVDLNKIHVMVAEDDKLTSFLISRFLKELGCSSTIVKNGLELLEAIKRKCPDECPDIILLDCHMPILNGEDTIRVLKKTPGLSHIPIIVTTGDIFSDTVDRMLAAGATTYLKKPVDHRALQKTMGLYLKKLPQN